MDYVACAQQLKNSILQWHPDAHVTILTKEMLPFGDQGGFANDWQCWFASPYRQTIKLEADMWCAGPVDHWWTMLEHRDVVISTGCRDIYDRTSNCRRYRKIFDDNHLPDVYNAVTYWRLSDTAREFWQLVRSLFENWQQIKSELKFPEEIPTTDVVYAIAAQLMGPDRVTLPNTTYPRIVHMKPGIIPTRMADWTQELVWELDHGYLRFNTITQWGMIHYNIKSWRP